MGTVGFLRHLPGLGQEETQALGPDSKLRDLDLCPGRTLPDSRPQSPGAEKGSYFWALRSCVKESSGVESISWGMGHLRF